MLTLRPAAARGHYDHGWLDTWHSFSFADYYDPAWMGFRGLRVINEDRVQPGGGFGMHPHRDMEIVTWILAGSLRHEDSLGHGSVIRPGEAQRMSAGTGIFHSEHNASAEEPVHLLQIWLLPERRGLAPGYEQRRLAGAGPLREIASRDGQGGGVRIHCDARILEARLVEGEELPLELAASRHAWVQVSQGLLELNGQALAAGDGAALSGEPHLRLTGGAAGGQALIFDLA
jgi:redox-sensitive bicupin YhaK (pirin superfamily)